MKDKLEVTIPELGSTGQAICGTFLIILALFGDAIVNGLVPV